MYSNPLGPSEKNSFCSKLQRMRDMVPTPFGTIFKEFGDTKKCCSFLGLELVPNQKKGLLALSAVSTKVQNTFKPFGTIRNKFLLLKTTKNARYVQSLGKKTHLGAFPEAKKGVARVQVR